MTALIFAPPPWHFFAFPLVVPWQARFEALAFYFPDLHFGLLQDKPVQAGFTTLLQPPRQQDLPALSRDYHPGELSQWQAYVDFLAAQEDKDEDDLKAAIRGHLEPVLPERLDREFLWSLAYQLERLLTEEASVLQRVAGQQQALEKVLAEDLGEEQELAHLEPGFNPSLTGGVPDPSLARVRYRFWREVLAPYLSPPWAALVLEPLAGESSPRYLWQTPGEEDTQLWQAVFTLPDWLPQPGQGPREMEALQLGVEFRKMLGELLLALREKQAELDACRQKMERLVEERLWPASGLPRARAIRLEVCGQLEKAPENEGLRLFLSPAD